jgi:glyceraldehyde-3-phosphate dehydrogenase/erythrose-4-phosphate dehydrogenase
MDIEYMKYLLLHDSAYYKPKFTVELYNKGLIVNGEKIRVYHTKLPVIIYFI